MDNHYGEQPVSDWSFPGLTQTWANFVAAIKGRDESNAKMDYSADSNIPDGAIRWSAANSRFEVWDATGLAWSELSSKYLINVDTVDSEHNTDFASAVGGSGARQAQDADTVDGVDLPGTIAQVLTDHTKAAHDALGIDAETLDGLSSTQFLRSDTSDAIAGALTVNGNLSVATGGSQSAPDISFVGDSDTGVYSNAANTIRVSCGGVFIGEFNANGLNLGATGAGSALEVSGNEVWHAGNADTAPGLDASKATTGYVDLPGGLILQWGQISVANDSSIADSFAKVFPTACLQAVACTDENRDNAVASVISFTTSTITVGNADNNVTVVVRWFAIGH